MATNMLHYEYREKAVVDKISAVCGVALSHVTAELLHFPCNLCTT